jgi:hypothetical protein
MRINELKEPAENALFENADVNKVLDVAISGNEVWSKPMSLEQAIAYTLGKTQDEIPNDSTNPNL